MEFFNRKQRRANNAAKANNNRMAQALQMKGPFILITFEDLNVARIQSNLPQEAIANTLSEVIKEHNLKPVGA